MPTTSAKIVLRVDPATAKAYRNASAEEKAHARSAFEQSLAERREQARQAAAQDLIEVMREISRAAEARGLTPEILEEILNEPPGEPGAETA